MPFTFENVELKSGANLKNESVNNINLRKLFLRSIKIDQDVKIKNLYVLDVVKAKEIEVGETVNGAHFSSSVVRYDSKKRQKMTGEWLFQKDLNINGSLVVEGYVSGLNLSELCRINPSGKINLIVGGTDFQSLILPAFKTLYFLFYTSVYIFRFG